MSDERLVPSEILLCGRCGYGAWRENYPCLRCGGVEPMRFVPASRLAEAQAAAWRAPALAEKYGEAIVKISEMLPNVNRARAIIVGLDTAEEA